MSASDHCYFTLNYTNCSTKYFASYWFRMAVIQWHCVRAWRQPHAKLGFDINICSTRHCQRGRLLFSLINSLSLWQWKLPKCQIKLSLHVRLSSPCYMICIININIGICFTCFEGVHTSFIKTLLKKTFSLLSFTELGQT